MAVFGHSAAGFEKIPENKNTFSILFSMEKVFLSGVTEIALSDADTPNETRIFTDEYAGSL
jgi:hypothetical protein